MPSSTVTITRNGRPASGIRVVLEWNGFVNLGQSDPVYTNSDGVAFIQHSSTGSATVYVDGKNQGKMSTPGGKPVRL